MGCGLKEPDMDITKPMTIDEDVLDYSNIAVDSDGYPEWESGEALDQLVILGTSESPYLEVYEQAGNTLTKLDASDVFDVEPTLSITSMEKTPDNRYLFCGTGTWSPIIYVYKRNVNQFKLIQKIQLSGGQLASLSYQDGYLLVGRGGESSTVIPSAFRIYRLANDKLTELNHEITYARRSKWSFDWIADNLAAMPFGSSPLTWEFSMASRSYWSLEGRTLKQITIDDSALLEKYGQLFEPYNGSGLFYKRGGPDWFVIATAANPYTGVGFFTYNEGLQQFDYIYYQTSTHGRPYAVAVPKTGNFCTVGGTQYSSSGVWLIAYSVEPTDLTVTRLSNPTQPGGEVRSLYWDDLGTYLYVGCISTQTTAFQFYSISGTTFTKRTNPSPNVTGSVYAIMHFPASSYLFEDTVYQDSNLYESLVNLNENDPSDDDPWAPAWLNLGKTNRWRMFEEYADSVTEGYAFVDSDFTASRWLTTNVTITSDYASPPPGETGNASFMRETADTGVHHIRKVQTVVRGNYYTASIYVKPHDTNWRYLAINWRSEAFGENNSDIFDPSTGTITQNNSGTATIESIGSGWYKVSTTKQATVNYSGNSVFNFRLSNTSTGTNPSYAGNTNYGLVIWGGQIHDGRIIVKLEKEGVKNIYLGGLDATQVRVERIATSTSTTPLESQLITLGADQTKLLATLATATSSTQLIRVHIYNDGDPAKCAILAIGGDAVELGQTKYEAESSALDFSKKSTDDWGRTFLKQGSYADIIRADVIVDNADYDAVGRALRASRGTNYIWNFNENGTNYESFIVYGFYKDHRRVLRGPNHAIMRLEIQEFT
jgi:hypothetical protein